MATETEVCNIQGAFLDKKEIHEWKEIIVHINLIFWMAASCHKPSPSQIWSLLLMRLEILSFVFVVTQLMIMQQKDHVTLWVLVSYHKPSPCHVSCPKGFEVRDGTLCIPHITICNYI